MLKLLAKSVAVIGITSVSSYVGLEIDNTYKKRIIFFQDLNNFVLQLIANLEVTNNDISNLFKSTLSELPSTSPTLTKLVSEFINKLSKSNLTWDNSDVKLSKSKAWLDCINNLSLSDTKLNFIKNLNLLPNFSAEDLILLNKLGSYLETDSSSTMLTTTLKTYNMQINTHLSFLETEFRQKNYQNTKLGVIIGLIASLCVI